jgi:hypothetical protein
MRARYARYREHFGLTAPRNGTFWVAVALGLLGLVMHYDVIAIGALDPYAVPMLAIGFVVLIAGCVARGL